MLIMVYKTADNYHEKRAPHRALHFSHVKKYVDQGLLTMGGAAGDPVDRAYIIFDSDDVHMAEEFARTDPYVLNGVVTEWKILPWHEVVASQIASKR